MRMSLVTDPFLKDDFFNETSSVILSGSETTERWQSQLNQEADRLGLPVIYAPAGDMYVPYASPETLIDILPKPGVTESVPVFY